ncbi:biotin/lipoate A/B protein ligase family protein [Natrialbaceae archaeon GCM10025810]|uniref:lipoate--protein ligase family protein n=1 Tax=Halovalidus salilacus TaxID=3075124 RepID=UPI00360CE528
MPQIRTLEATVAADTYPAIERTLIDGISGGESEPTVMQWTFDDDLFLELGPVEDAALIDRDRAEAHGVSYGRRYNVSGGTGFFRQDHTPVLYAFFPDRGEHTMAEYIDLAGEAMAGALRDAGVENATYRDGGDVELVPEDDGQLLKIGVSGAGYQDGVWGVFANVIYRSYGPDEFEIINDVMRLPKEKFEDKETDSVEGRMTSVTEVAPDLELAAVLDAATERLADIAGGTPEPGSFTEEEEAAVESHRQAFGDSEWFEHYSTTELIESAGPDDRVAEVAYKGRKLIKASVCVNADGTIDRMQFTGDMYHRPGFDTIDRLNEAVAGTELADDDALRAAVESVYQQEDVEIPWLPPEDFVQPLRRARDNLVPASEFSRE